MADGRSDRAERLKWWLSLPLILVLLSFVAIAGDSSAGGRVHAAVFSWADQNPDQPVPVLVQTTADSSTVAELITESGGDVARQFSMMPLVEATVSREHLSTLASHPDVKWVSLNAAIVSTARPVDGSLNTTYTSSIGAGNTYSKGYSGAGVSVAIVDTGITHLSDFGGDDGAISLPPWYDPYLLEPISASRVVADVAVNPDATSTNDGFGHGTHIAGIVAGDNVATGYVGVAPGANLINVKVADDAGSATLGDVIDGLEFVYNNKEAFNIRVVNLSLHSSVSESYKTDPLCAAAEILWFSGIFVVAAAGNLGTAVGSVDSCPGSDPFVMTVGARDEGGTSSLKDDTTPSWSSVGVTHDGFAKPELLAPGVDIVSTIDPASVLFNAYPHNVMDASYFRMSGTSMAAGVMSGIAALVLEANPGVSPGELKCALIDSAKASGVPVVDRVSFNGSTICDSNAGLIPADLVLRGPVIIPVGVIAFVLGSADPAATAAGIGLGDLALIGIANATLDNVDWDKISWDKISWDKISWDKISWDKISWDKISWDKISWDKISWDKISWDKISWDKISWDAVLWGTGDSTSTSTRPGEASGVRGSLTEPSEDPLAAGDLQPTDIYWSFVEQS